MMIVVFDDGKSINKHEADTKYRRRDAVIMPADVRHCYLHLYLARYWT